MCASCTTSASTPTVVDLDHRELAGPRVADDAEPAVDSPKRIGSPWVSGMIASAEVSRSLIASNASSLKIGQFW